MTDEWTEADEAQFRVRIRERLPIACACIGPDLGETLCPCDKAREVVRQEIAEEKRRKPE